MVDPKLGFPSSSKKKARWLKNPPMILPVKLCGEDSYQDSLGFVLVSDLDVAQNSVDPSKSLPPSIEPNPIPALRQDD